MNALEIVDLKKTYANKVEALKSISFNVEEGDFFALLGPNGAGKSTTIGIITSLVNKSSGKVRVFGYDMDTQLSEVKRCIGLVPQEFNFNIFETVEQILVNQAGFYGVPKKIALERSKTILQKLGLWSMKNFKAQMLSGGMKRRLMIARALVHDPKLLILDEPTAGVDIELRRQMWDFLREINAQGKTVILTTHYLEEAESLCKNITIIDQGHIVANTDMKSLLQKLHVQTYIFDLSLPILQAPITEQFKIRWMDPLTLEVEVENHQTLNSVFQLLSNQGLIISSMRNKSNRLEELFLKITGNHQ